MEGGTNIELIIMVCLSKHEGVSPLIVGIGIKRKETCAGQHLVGSRGPWSPWMETGK